MNRKKDDNSFGGLRMIFQSSQVPERLMPDSIKDMLDRHGYKKPKRNIARIAASCTAVAAAAAVAVGAFKFIGRDGFSESEMREYAAKHISTMRFAESYDDVYKFLDSIKEERKVYDEEVSRVLEEQWAKNPAGPEEYGSWNNGVDEYGVAGDEESMDITMFHKLLHLEQCLQEWLYVMLQEH